MGMEQIGDAFGYLFAPAKMATRTDMPFGTGTGVNSGTILVQILQSPGVVVPQG